MSMLSMIETESCGMQVMDQIMGQVVSPLAKARDVLASLHVSRVPPSASSCNQYLLS